MKMIVTPVALFCAIALAIPAAAFAQENAPDPLMAPSPAGEQKFEELDSNGDGYLEQVEVPVEHELSQQFAQADTDRDSRLSRIEFDAYLDEPEEEEAEE